jgi:hypothetical protein
MGLVSYDSSVGSMFACGAGSQGLIPNDVLITMSRDTLANKSFTDFNSSHFQFIL